MKPPKLTPTTTNDSELVVAKKSVTNTTQPTSQNDPTKRNTQDRPVDTYNQLHISTTRSGVNYSLGHDEPNSHTTNKNLLQTPNITQKPNTNLDYENLPKFNNNFNNQNNSSEPEEENELTQHQQQILDTITEDNTNIDSEFNWEFTEKELIMLENLTNNGNPDDTQNSTEYFLQQTGRTEVAHNPETEVFWDLTEFELSQLCNTDTQVAITDITLPSSTAITTTTTEMRKPNPFADYFSKVQKLLSHPRNFTSIICNNMESNPSQNKDISPATDLLNNKFQHIKHFCKTHLKFCIKDNHNWGYPPSQESK